MTYHVRWTQSAMDQLSIIWLSVEPEARSEISKASGETDRQLRAAPYAQSESRDGGRRITFVAPLAIEFRVSDEDMLDSVLHIWRFRRRSD